MYKEKIIDAFVQQANAGDLKGATVKAIVKSKNYGDVVQLSLKINDNLIVEDIKYKSFGGVVTSLYASKLCDMVRGINLVLAQQISSEELATQLPDLPSEKQQLASLPVIALMEAIKKFLKRRNSKQQ